MKPLRDAFTIIEILISVIILSFAIIFVLQVHTDNKEQIIYISQRNTLSLQDSLYLDPTVLQHHKDKKSAYDLLERFFRVQEQKSREILKTSKREIFIPEEIRIFSPQEIQGPSATVNTIMLKGQHSAIYHRLNIDAF